MKRTILVCGHGPGISHAVAKKFGAEGFAVALVARSADKLAAAASELEAAGLSAKAFPCDLGDPEAVRGVVRRAREALGPIHVVHYNAYTGGAGDLTTAPIDELRKAIDVSVSGMIAVTQESLADLRESKGALLVTGGGLAFFDPKVDGMAVSWGSMGLAVAKAAQHKAVGLLHAKLAPEGVYVGEVVVLGLVKGTAWDHGNATLEPSAIADKFHAMFQSRTDATANFS
ncbi:MAG: SDR family NAD(P)-dependent oxidoreductase [Polyangiaceae bacterium]